MKKITLIILTVFAFGISNAQTVNNSLKISIDKTKHIAIDVRQAWVDLEGYDGDEIIIEPSTKRIPQNMPLAAASLSLIKGTNTEPEDNTISYRMIGAPLAPQLFQFAVISKCKYLHILVPNNLNLLSITPNADISGTTLNVNNYKGPIQISGNVDIVNVKRVTGPFSINFAFAKIFLSDILWNSEANWSYHKYPYMISSTSADIDIALPKNLKASLNISNAQGQVFTDLDMDNKLQLNGGGIKIQVNALNGNNIYLRKQK